jgi:hypothetical protein
MSTRFPTTLTPDALAAYTKQVWTAQETFYSTFLVRWQRTMDFLRGIHWRPTDLSSLSLLRDPELARRETVERWRRYPIVNTTFAFYQDYLMQWLQSRVRFSATPVSPDPDDVAAASLADKVLAGLWDSLTMEHHRVDIGAWLVLTGNADVRIFWNTDTGNLVPSPTDPSTLVDAGEIGVEVIPPFYCRHPLDHPGSVLVGVPYSYDQAAQRFGEEKADQLSYGTIAVPSLLTMDMMTIEGIALVTEHYLPRSAKFPQGLWWVSSNQVLLDGPYPLPSRYPPVVHFRWVPLPGHPYMGLSPLYDLTFLNKLAERALKPTLEWAEKVTPKILRKRGDGLADGDLQNDEPFAEIVTPPGMEPGILQVPEPPAIFDRIRQEMTELSLVIGGYRFVRPKEPEPGTQLPQHRVQRTLNEAGVMGLAVMNSKAAWQRFGTILLDFVSNFYDDRRAIAIVGQDRTYQWVEFKQTDLARLNAHIHVDELPLFTWNREAMKNTILGLLDSNAAQAIFTKADGQLDRERLDAALEGAGVDLPFETLDPDILAARNENAAFARGEATDVGPRDDDAQHLQEHDRVLKSLTFKAWPEEAQQAFLQHIAEHEQRLAEQQRQQQQTLFEQEQGLRSIRAAIESSKDVRSAFGEALVDLFTEALQRAMNRAHPTEKENSRE